MTLNAAEVLSHRVIPANAGIHSLGAARNPHRELPVAVLHPTTLDACLRGHDTLGVTPVTKMALSALESLAAFTKLQRGPAAVTMAPARMPPLSAPAP